LWVGLYSIVVEYLYSDRKVKVEDVDSLSVREALIIGFGQIFSLIPGTSRAGIYNYCRYVESELVEKPLRSAHFYRQFL